MKKIVAFLLLAAHAYAGGIATTSLSITYTNGADNFQQTIQPFNTSLVGSNRAFVSIVVTNGGYTAIPFTTVGRAGITFGRDLSTNGTPGFVQFSYDGTNAAWGVQANGVWYNFMATNQLYATVIDGTAPHTIAPNIFPK